MQPVPEEKWYGLEVQVKTRRPRSQTQTQTQAQGHLFIDGTEPGHHIQRAAVASVVNTGWTGARMLRLGARSHSARVERPLYIDNLSVLTTRVGCINP